MIEPIKKLCDFVHIFPFKSLCSYTFLRSYVVMVNHGIKMYTVLEAVRDNTWTEKEIKDSLSLKMNCGKY